VDEGIHVPAGGDRFELHREVFGTRRIDYKVSTLDSNGGFFVSEIVDHLKGGPARHLHHEQEEWFYVVEGEYAIDVGDEKYRLGPGRFRAGAEGSAARLGPRSRRDGTADRHRPARWQA
jgi:mannose-6-phosphate isomerase-like protein (cupin superfamily)